MAVADEGRAGTERAIVAPLPVLSYRGVVERDHFVTLGRFRSTEAGELAARLEAFDIRAIISINPAHPSEVELQVAPADVERALEVIVLPDHHFFCPACGSARHEKMAFPPRAQLWRASALCLFLLPILCLVIVNTLDANGDTERLRIVIQILTVPIGVTALLILRAVSVRFPRRFRCGQCGYLWLPD
jgi:hypothetical protein